MQNTIRHAILAIALIAGITPAIAQVPPPVPALPDTPRINAYSLTASTCACSVGFALYGDSTDFTSWVEVWLNGVQQVGNWTITSPTGPLATIARPITDAVLTFTSAQTGTVQIVGALRPRRTSQFSENAGVSARNLNQAITYIISSLREFWDKLNDVTGRTILGVPGEKFPPLPPAATRANGVLCFNGSGVPVVCAGTLSGVTVSAPLVPFVQASSLAAAFGLFGLTGLDTNILNTQTSNYPIVVGDAGHTIYVTGGPFTVTLPAITGFVGNEQIRVCNGNPNTITSHAVLLSGFPNPLLPRLYPQQCASVAIESGVWAATAVPGRFRPAFSPVLFVDNGGSDSNDGLVSNASSNALQTMSKCISTLYLEYDLVGNQPTCSPTGGQTLVGSFAQVGLPLNSSVINILGNGGQAILRPTPGTNFIFEMNDFAGYFITKNVTFDCTGGATQCFGVFFHQQGGGDLNAGTQFTGSGTSNTAVQCDSVCKVNIDSDVVTTMILNGSFGTAFSGSLGSMFVFSNGLTLNNGASVSGNLIQMQQNSVVQFSGGLNAAAGTSVGGSVFALQSNSTGCLSSNFTQSWVVQPNRKFAVLDNSVLLNASPNVIPGTSAGVVTATGHAPGFAPDNAGGNTGINAGSC